MSIQEAPGAPFQPIVLSVHIPEVWGQWEWLSLCLQLARLLLGSSDLKLRGLRYWWWCFFLIHASDLSCSQEQAHQRKSWVTGSSLLSLFQFTQNSPWEKQGHHFCEWASGPLVFSPVWSEIMLLSVWEVKLLRISTFSLLILHFSLTTLNLNFRKKLILNYCTINDCTAQQYNKISWKAGVWSNLSQNSLRKIK